MTGAWRATLDRLVEHFIATLMAVMTVNVVWQVASRYLVGRPSTVTDELARYLFMWLALVGAAYAAGRHLHLAVDVLTQRLRPRARQRLQTFSWWCVALLAVAILMVGGSRLVYITSVLDQRSPALNLPMALVYAALPASGLLMLVYAMAGILAARGQGSPGSAAQGRSVTDPA